MGMVAPDDFRVQPESQRVATAYVVLAQMLGKPGCVLERMTATWLQRASNRMAGVLDLEALCRLRAIKG